MLSFSNKIGETKKAEPDLKTYEKISGHYYKDKNYYFYFGNIVKKKEYLNEEINYISFINDIS